MNTPKLPPFPWGDDFQAWLEVRSDEEIQAEFAAYARAAIEAQGVPEHCDPSITHYELAAMIMSDCGHSTNNQRLLDRIASRIQKRHDALIASAQPAPQANPDRTGMTYYKNNDCKAPSADHPDCICWTPAPQASVVQQEPMFWVRLCSDGLYEGPIHNKQLEDVRRYSGAWTPLYTHPAQQAKPQPLSDARDKRIAELEDSLSTWRRNAEIADQANRELGRQLEEARKDAERWRTFLSTRPQSTHEVIIQAIDDAAMRKGAKG